MAYLQDTLAPDCPLPILAPLQKADETACAAFLDTHAAPLLALSLYVSSANWAAATRPAYSSILPFPLTWTDPPTIRASQLERAEHLGLSSLDTDADPSDEHGGPGQGLFSIPESLRRVRKAVSVSAALTPEQKAQIRLDEAARQCLSPLGELKKEKPYFISEDRPLAIDCLVFGYLALMLLPEVPRPWLRDILRTKYNGLCTFVKDMRAQSFGSATLPWVSDPTGVSVLSLSSRLVQGAVRNIPGVGEELQCWVKRILVDQKKITRSDIVYTTCAVVAGAVAVAGVVLYRRLPPFGSPIQHYHRRGGGLLAFGAVGEMFGVYHDSVGEGRLGGTMGGDWPMGFEDVPIEIGKEELGVGISDVD